MNYLWTVIVTLSVVLITATGKADFLSCAIEGAGNAVAVTVSLLAVYCVWNGFFAILTSCGLAEKLSRVLAPIVKLLFGIKGNPQAQQYVALNVSANLLGVSNASTPSAVKAMSELESDNTKLSYQGAMLFVFNACGVQLVPSTAVGMRASMGSTSAYDTLLPTLLTSVATLVLGVALVNIAYRRKEK